MKKILIAALIAITAALQLLDAQKQPYHPGEKVTYQIKYGIVGSGQASLELSEGFHKGQPVWHAVISGKTTGLADALYRVRDVYESYIDPENDLPVFSIRNIQEGRYRKYNEVGFDHMSETDSTLIVSCFYWFRKYYLASGKELIPGETYKMMTWFADELYPIILRYKGKETVRVRGKRIECYRFHPVTEVGRVFKTEEDMAMWFTTDENFLPVKIRFDIFVGSFYVDMVSYEGLRAPLSFID